MKPITFNSSSYLIDGKPVYLNSGEFHYFRVPSEDWRTRMLLLKEAGGNCLATYVPWVIHEPQEGRFVFGEQGFNDLERFLQTAAEVGLYVIARPGPYQYSELLYNGLPHWLCQDYPELLAVDIQGKLISPASISYLHPLFLEKAERWFDQVTPILARYTISRGGPIAFTQVDNELAGIHVWFSGPDYHPVTMGFGQPDGRWTRFLQQRYGDMNGLNHAYGQSFTSFEAVPPAPMNGGSAIPALRQRKDYFDFYFGTVHEYGALLANWLRQRSIDTPIIHNSAAPEMNALFKAMPAAIGGEFLLGSDHYYNLDQNWPQNNPTPQYARRVFFSNEMLRLMGYPPTVHELPGGSLADWPAVTPQDAKACYWANLALGMKGHNYYIFTGGPNPAGVGGTSDLYDYGASISAAGEVRPLYAVQQEYGLYLRQRSWLAEAEREADCRFTLDWEAARANYYWQERADWSLTAPDAWRLLVSGPLTTAFCASASPVFCDFDGEDWAKDLSTPVITVCSPVMTADQQKRLVRFLEAGGKSLLLPVLPQYDQSWQPCSLLKDFLGVGAIHAGRRTPTRLTILDVVNIYNNGQAFFLEDLPSTAEVIGVDERSGKPVCASFKTSGGEAILLGFEWLHAMRSHEALLRALLKRLGWQPRVTCSNPNVWTSLRTAGSRSALFLLNLNSVAHETAVRCHPAWSEKIIDAGVHQLAPMSVKTIELPA